MRSVSWSPRAFPHPSHAFGRVRVRGEVSRPNYHGSGHLYFTLKDEDAVIDGVCWKNSVAKLALKIEEGMDVICSGRISSYSRSSRYQIVIDSVELAGEGALLKLLEDRRKKLTLEGIFEPERKKVSVNIGENSLAFYKAKNKTDQTINTMSVFNVTPLQAGKYFNKIECFCFEEQTLNPREEVEMPVTFFIDPSIKNDKFINDLSEITLSYTMFIKE